jgi:hypothetical protein
MRGKIRVRQATGPSDMVGIAKLLFQKDKPFVPVTSLARLNDLCKTGTPHDGSFLVASINDDPQFRCCTSYQHWAFGCGDADADPKLDVSVYELASTLVRDPMGGFDPPGVTMQQVLAFARILEIIGAGIFRPEVERGAPDAEGQYYCLIACILAGNRRSTTGLTNLGMTRVSAFPAWLEYEHRTWVTRRSNRKERDIKKEATYLWLSPQGARDFITRMIPIADGRQPISRPSKNKPGMSEEFLVDFETPAIRQLRTVCGSIEAAARHFDYSLLSPPPARFRVGDSVY